MSENRSRSDPQKKTKKSVDHAVDARHTSDHKHVSTHQMPDAQQHEAVRDQKEAIWLRWVGRLTKSSRKSRIIITILAVLLLTNTAYAAVYYLPNTPAAVYARGLANSSNAINNLVNDTQQFQSATYKSILINGSMKGSDVLGRYTINLSGTENKSGDGLFSASGNVDGMTLSSNIRTVGVAGKAMPDAYVKSKDLDALKPLIGIQGLPTFNQFDNKWILIDHNLLESYYDNLMRAADKQIDKNHLVPGPSLAQLSDALTRIQTVSKQYLLSTNSSTEIFKDPTYIGTLVENGRPLNQYQVTYDPAHLASYLQALGEALNSSQLNAWSQQSSYGRSLQQLFNLGSVGHGAHQMVGTKNTADIWIDHNSKTITEVQINHPSASLSSVAITQRDAGGNQYSFAVTFNGKDDSGVTYVTTIQVAIDPNTHTTTLGFNTQSQADGLHNDLNSSISFTPSNKTIQVSAPSGAVPFLTALGPSGLSNFVQP